MLISFQVKGYGILEITLKATVFGNTFPVALSVSSGFLLTMAGWLNSPATGAR